MLKRKESWKNDIVESTPYFFDTPHDDNDQVEEEEPSTKSAPPDTVEEEEADLLLVDGDPNHVVSLLYGLLFWYAPVFTPSNGNLFHDLRLRYFCIVSSFDVPVAIQTGITHNPIQRAKSHVVNGYHRMFIILEDNRADVVDLCESHLIEHLPLTLTQTGKNKAVYYDNEQRGGAGNMRTKEPPYYLYFLVRFGLERLDGLVPVGFRECINTS
jgi:hypothetical protein